MLARLVVLASLLVPSVALAAVEVTPLAGYRAGGLEIETGTLCVTLPCPTFAESDDSALYGAIVGLPINDRYQFELLLNRQPSELVFTEGPGVPRRSLGTTDFDVTHVHAGVLRRWRLSSFEPFVSVSGGQTWIDANSFLIGNLDENLWSGSVAAGARVPLGKADRFGLRLEARGYLVDIPSGGLGDSEFPRALEDDLTQLETSVGVTFRF